MASRFVILAAVFLSGCAAPITTTDKATGAKLVLKGVGSWSVENNTKNDIELLRSGFLRCIGEYDRLDPYRGWVWYSLTRLDIAHCTFAESRKVASGASALLIEPEDSFFYSGEYRYSIYLKGSDTLLQKTFSVQYLRGPGFDELLDWRERAIRRECSSVLNAIEALLALRGTSTEILDNSVPRALLGRLLRVRPDVWRELLEREDDASFLAEIARAPAFMNLAGKPFLDRYLHAYLNDPQRYLDEMIAIAQYLSLSQLVLLFHKFHPDTVEEERGFLDVLWNGALWKPNKPTIQRLLGVVGQSERWSEAARGHAIALSVLLKSGDAPGFHLPGRVF